MSDDAPGPMTRRILVALDAAERSTMALEAAARLAAGLKAELVGLFIEDTELLEAAALPVTRIIPSQAWTAGALDPDMMQRAWRIWSAESRKTLEAAAARWHVRCSFQVTRGAFAEQLLAQTDEHDILTFQTNRRMSRTRGDLAARHVAAQARCSVLLMERRAFADKPVMVICEGGRQMLTVGRTIADIYNLGLVVLALGQSGGAAKASAAEARRFLKDEPRLAAVEALPDAAAAGVGDLLRRYDPGVVIFQRLGRFAGKVEQALADSDCSVLVVG